jgi:ribosome-binding factor A
MKEQSIRAKRMSSLIRSEIARLLIAETGDPRLQSLGITEVVLTGDLKQARVFYETHGNVKEVERGLKRATPFFRKKLGEALNLRYVPALEFELDHQAENLHRLMDIMGNMDTPSGDGA